MRILTVIFLVTVLVLAGCSQSGSQTKRSGAEQGSPGRGSARTAPEQTRTELQRKPQSAAQQSIPGLDADRTARLFEQEGLRCKQPRGSSIIYNCTSEGNLNLSLLYVGQVIGSSPKQVSSVAAEVIMTASGGDLTSAAQTYFGVVARRIDYQGADARKARAFVYKNLSGTNSASITIGPAKWSLLSNPEVKVLEVASTK